METEKKTVQDLIKAGEDAFSNFVFLIFYSNPAKNTVRIILDDGDIKMFIRRDKFLIMLEKVLDFTNKQTIDNYIKIQEAINSYGKWYLFDRSANEVRELTENIDYEHFRPQDLIEETRKNMNDPEESRYKGLVKQYTNEVEDKMVPKNNPGIFGRYFNKGWSVIRNFTKT